MKRAQTASSAVSPTRNSLPEATRHSVTERLNGYLATLTDLYSQAKHAHWNVRGSEFYQLHLLFDRVAEMVESHIDPLAERITALGGIALGTIRMAAAASPLDEFPTEPSDGLAYVHALADRFARAANDLRVGIDETDEADDLVSSDLLTGIVADLDKALYLLEAHSPRGES
ncbi:MAG: DNA starvation/stationary phase protection protein [Isosphaeraceae bacterium]|jgi:starvation-inducible DNA-binding protein|nr:MAG: DNA starvation/stationary phase protection protein [Isosphaeraceae bacterium]